MAARMGARELAMWRDCSTEVNLRLVAEDGSTVRVAFLVPRARLSWRAGSVEVQALQRSRWRGSVAF